MAYRRSPASTASIQLPSFNQAFRTNSPNNGFNHVQPPPNQQPEPRRTNNHLPPLRYNNASDAEESRPLERRGSDERARKRVHEEVDESARPGKATDVAPVKNEPISPSPSPTPKRQRTHPDVSPRSLALSPPRPGHPISPAVAGFTIDPHQPEAAEQVQLSLSVKRQQQQIIQSRKDSSASSSSGWAAPDPLPGTPPQTAPPRVLPPSTVASRRGPLTASKAATLTIQTPSHNAPAYPNTSAAETHTFVPQHAYNRSVHHPTSALRADLQPAVQSAPPQRTRFEIGPRPTGPPQAGPVGRPTLNISHTGRQSQSEFMQNHVSARPLISGAGTVPLARSNTSRTPSILRPVREGSPPPPHSSGTPGFPGRMSTGARPPFVHTQSQPGNANQAGHHAPFGSGSGASHMPLQTAPLPASHRHGDVLQQQQAQRPSYPAQVPATANPFVTASGRMERQQFLEPFGIFYDSILDAQRLKHWLKAELDKAQQVNASLQDHHVAIERLVESRVQSARDEWRAERESLEGRVRQLEDRLRAMESRAAPSAGRALTREPEGQKEADRPRAGTDADGMQVDDDHDRKQR